MPRVVSLCIAGVLFFSGPLGAAVVNVVSSGGFAAAYRVLAPEFERTTGNTLVTNWGPSMENTREAVPDRLWIRSPA
jgi:molybdate transport system substrate-binding protein